MAETVTEAQALLRERREVERIKAAEGIQIVRYFNFHQIIFNIVEFA